MKHKINVSYPFILLLSFCYAMDENNLLPYVLPAILAHELAHIAAIRLCGGRIRRIDICAGGARIELCSYPMLSYRKEIVIAFAGAAGNLILILISALFAHLFVRTTVFYIFMSVNLLFLIVNLIPIKQLDGGRALYYLICLLHSEAMADFVLLWLGCVLSTLVIAAGILFFWLSGYNITLLLIGAYLLGCQVYGRRNKKLAHR